MEDQDYATTFDLENHNWWFVGTREICLDLLDAYAPERDAPLRIVDVGCGTGSTLVPLGERGEVVGLDYSPLALQFCRQRTSVPLLRGDGANLPLADGSVDVLSAIGVLEHLEDDATALRDWARALAPDGTLVMLTSAYEWMWSGHDTSNHHTRRYTAGELGRLLVRNGLEPLKISYVNTVLFPPIALVRLFQRLARRDATPDPRKDTAEVPPPVNRALLALMRLERRAIAQGRLPFGVSIVASARPAPIS